ncbi:hypothetical protein ACFYY5_29310 [Nocardia elegans]|uniref:Uncharacterized protein n=1 Tax=Nocardia elegans TaxID=300029 RepID=A0ABW6TLE0_9NOCA
MIDPDLIAEGRAKLRAATYGPWEIVEEIDGVRAGRLTVVKAGDGAERRRVVTVDQTRPHHEPAEANIELIVWMQNHLSTLLDELEYSHVALERLKQAVEQDFAAIAEKQRQYRERIAAEEKRAGEAARLAIAAQEKVDRVQAVLTAAETETPDSWGLTYVYTSRLRNAIEGTPNA